MPTEKPHGIHISQRDELRRKLINVVLLCGGVAALIFVLVIAGGDGVRRLIDPILKTM